jgi:uncharacterized protein YdhG (YjbR/CyaY superfamily)
MNKDVRRYLTAVPDDRKETVIKLHDLILGLFPDAEVDMSYKMPTYRHGDGWVALANQKHYVSLYTCGEHHIAGFRDKYPAIKTGKGCINFRSKDPVPVTALKQVIRHAMRQKK